MIINIILDELIAISNVSMENKRALSCFRAWKKIQARRKRNPSLHVKPNMCNYFPDSYPSASPSWRVSPVILSIAFFSPCLSLSIFFPVVCLCTFLRQVYKRFIRRAMCMIFGHADENGKNNNNFDCSMYCLSSKSFL